MSKTILTPGILIKKRVFKIKKGNAVRTGASPGITRSVESKVKVSILIWNSNNIEKKIFSMILVSIFKLKLKSTYFLNLSFHEYFWIRSWNQKWTEFINHTKKFLNNSTEN